MEYDAKKKDYNAKDKGNTMQKIGSTIQKLKGNTIQKIKGNKLLNWHSSSLEASLHPSLGKYLATTSLPSSKLYDARRQLGGSLANVLCQRLVSSISSQSVPFQDSASQGLIGIASVPS